MSSFRIFPFAFAIVIAVSYVHGNIFQRILKCHTNDVSRFGGCKDFEHASIVAQLEIISQEQCFGSTCSYNAKVQEVYKYHESLRYIPSNITITHTNDDSNSHKLKDDTNYIITLSPDEDEDSFTAECYCESSKCLAKYINECKRVELLPIDRSEESAEDNDESADQFTGVDESFSALNFDDKDNEERIKSLFAQFNSIETDGIEKSSEFSGLNVDDNDDEVTNSDGTEGTAADNENDESDDSDASFSALNFDDEDNEERIKSLFAQFNSIETDGLKKSSEFSGLNVDDNDDEVTNSDGSEGTAADNENDESDDSDASFSALNFDDKDNEERIKSLFAQFNSIETDGIEKSSEFTAVKEDNDDEEIAPR